MHSTDGHDHTVARTLRGNRAEIIKGKFFGKPLVVMVDGKKDRHKNWREDQYHPGAVTESCDRDNNQHNCGTEGTKTIDHHAILPTMLISQRGTRLNNFLSLCQVTNLPPAPRHACLGECKGQKNADRI